MKGKFLSVVLIGFLVVFIAADAFAQSSKDKVYKWRFQAHWPAGSASFKPTKEFVEEKIKNITGGRLQITFFPAGGLVPYTQIFDSCRKGMFEGAMTSPTYHMALVPIVGVAANCPMTFHDPWEGLYFHMVMGFEDMLKAEHAKHNLLYYTDRIYPTAMVCKKPIRKLEDFKGLKIRSSGAIADFLRSLGAATSLIPGAELYLALQTGVIDGAHWGAAGGALTMKLCEVAKYYVQPNFAMAGTDAFLINKDAFNSLPKDIQKDLEWAMKERIWRRTHEYIMDELDALETMKKKFNVQVTTLPPEDQKKMAKLAIKQWDMVGAKDAVSGKAIGMMKDFLKKLGYID
jgi:TRAP-type mannitol/chloroaromatic compound transport system substrate-binding protein